MGKIFTRKLIPIFILGIVALYYSLPTEIQQKFGYSFTDKINLGLDLQGGTQLDYKIDLSEISEVDRTSIINGITEVINKRVNSLGVSEPNIYNSLLGDEVHIIVELAGIKDIEEAKSKVGKIIQLEFKESITNEDGTITWSETELNGRHFVRADAVVNQYGQSQVAIKFNTDGRDLFAKITENNIGKPVAIFVGGEMISSPTVNEKILAGEAIISGNFTTQEATTLARDLNTGAIPAPIELSGQYTIGASLGQEALNESLRAGIYGIIALAIFMVGYYGMSGLLANLALVIYSAVLIALIKVSIPMGISFFIAILIYAILIKKIIDNEDSGWEKLISFFVASFVFFFMLFLLSSGIVLTLAGIAGVILSIGMAVDANVLIFERIKEEFASGKEMKKAVEIGFQRAWSSIRDSNYSSLITCAILVYFGTSIIKGFAINLAAGILISMFSAITITKAFFDFMASSKSGEKLLTYGLKKRIKMPKLDIIKNSKIWFAISGTLVGASIILLGIFGLNLGIDFTGGAMMEIKFTEPLTKNQLSESILKIDEGIEADLSTAQIITADENSFIIRTKELTSIEHDLLIAKLKEAHGELSEPRFTVVGPIVGDALKSKALIALSFTTVMIILYIAFAFRHIPKEISPWRFGASAIFALLHDIIITIGVFVVLGRFFGVEIDALFITALLTIMGFSVHDTIVVFDRIRENIFKAGKQMVSFDMITNDALNQTMARSLNTSVSTLLTIASLFLFGAESVKHFVFALLFGIIVGTYSSIFIASTILCSWKKKSDSRKA